MKYLLILALLVVGCGQAPETIPAKPAPSLIQGDCETNGGVYFHFIERTCDVIGTACITKSGSDLYKDGVSVPAGSCLSDYLISRGL